MNSFELNKLIGAFLGAVFIIFSVSLISDAVFHAPAPETPGYAIAIPESEGSGSAEPEAAPESVLPLLAAADASAGANIFKRCQACHTSEQGGPNKVGPNLWGVVNRHIASHEGFSYSAAMQEFSQGGEATWTYENLDHFILSPKDLVPGTAMSFAGLKKIEDRANVIAYLRTLADDPAPLPEAAPAEGAATEAAPAPGDEAAPAAGEAQPAPADAGQEAAPAAGGAESAPVPAGDMEAAPSAPEEAPAAPDAAESGAEGDSPEPAPAQ